MSSTDDKIHHLREIHDKDVEILRSKQQIMWNFIYLIIAGLVMAGLGLLTITQ